VIKSFLVVKRFSEHQFGPHLLVVGGGGEHFVQSLGKRFEGAGPHTGPAGPHTALEVGVGQQAAVEIAVAHVFVRKSGAKVELFSYFCTQNSLINTW